MADGRWQMADGGDALVGAPGGWKGLILPTSSFILLMSEVNQERCYYEESGSFARI
jgi:hypothetical protein